MVLPIVVDAFVSDRRFGRSPVLREIVVSSGRVGAGRELLVVRYDARSAEGLSQAVNEAALWARSAAVNVRLEPHLLSLVDARYSPHVIPDTAVSGMDTAESQ